MKNFGWKIFAIFLVGSVIYGAYTGLYIVGDDQFGVLKDEAGGANRYLYPGYNIVYQNLVPGRVKVTLHRKKAADSIEIKIPVSPLQDLKSDYYNVILKVNISYEISTRELTVGPEDFAENPHAVTELLTKILQSHFEKKLYPYMVPNYNRAAMSNAVAQIIKDAAREVSAFALGMGVKINTVESAGNMYLPDNKTYFEGLALMDQIRTIENNNRKEMLIIKNSLEKEKLLKQEYLGKLGDISKLIKENPDLLKYIYIDRLAGNVKVIIAPEKTGMPLNLDSDNKTENKKLRGEVDNLR